MSLCLEPVDSYREWRFDDLQASCWIAAEALGAAGGGINRPA
jgi:hypothetical protein